MKKGFRVYERYIFRLADNNIIRLSHDRRGMMTTFKLNTIFCKKKLEQLKQKKVSQAHGFVAVAELKNSELSF